MPERAWAQAMTVTPKGTVAACKWMVKEFVRVPWAGMVHKLPARVLVTFAVWPQLELNTKPSILSTVVSSCRQSSTHQAVTCSWYLRIQHLRSQKDVLDQLPFTRLAAMLRRGERDSRVQRTSVITSHAVITKPRITPAAGTNVHRVQLRYHTGGQDVDS